MNVKQEAQRIEREHKGQSKPRPVKPSIGDFFALIWRLLFYNPVLTAENQRQHNVRFIYVHFSAWHFAGSDLLWAGIAIRLFQAMQMNFGKLQIVLFRVAQYDEEDEVKKKVCHLPCASIAIAACTLGKLCFSTKETLIFSCQNQILKCKIWKFH